LPTRSIFGQTHGGDVAASATTTPESQLPRETHAKSLRIAVYLGCAALLLALIAFNFVDIDIWHQMNLVRASLAAGHLLTADPFAYTPTVHPMIDHEWGAGVLAFFLGKWMGGAGILLLKFASAFGTLFLTMRLAERRGAALAVVGFLAPICIGLLYFGFLSAVRAQAYSFFLTACLLYALEIAREQDRPGEDSPSGDRPSEARPNKDRRWLWAFLVVFPIWVNLHAGFVVGIGFVFLYCVEQTIIAKSARTAMIMLCAMVLEVFVNPYGVQYFSYLARALTMSRPRIPEWSPLWTLGSTPTVLFAVAVCLVIYALTKSKTWRTPGILLLAATAIEALLHRKMLPFFAIAWLAYVPASFQGTSLGTSSNRSSASQWLEQFAQKRRRFLILAWTALITACLVSAIHLKFWQVEVPQIAGDLSYPVGAVDYLAAQNFHGNIMVPFRPGAYVSWKLYPNIKVSVDSRYEVAYPDEWVERVFRFYEAGQGGKEGWRETLNAYPTDLVLVPRSASVLAPLHKLGWKTVYVDAQFELAARPGLELSAVDRSADSFSGVFP
jgi:hypothetical protein